MAGKRKKGKKVRVDFRRNRQQRRRESDLTQRYRDTDRRDELVDGLSSESIRAKGDLSRKRTIIVDENDAPMVDEAGWQRGIVIEMHGRVCQVEPDTETALSTTPQPNWTCTVRRVLRTMMISQRSRVTVGDRVWFSDQSAHHDGNPIGVIERVTDRTTTLSRRDRRCREHTIVANADQILIVTSVACPRLKPHLIDRYLIAAAKGGLRPIIVFNKWDLLESDEKERHEGPGARRREGEDDPLVPESLVRDSNLAPLEGDPLGRDSHLAPPDGEDESHSDSPPTNDADDSPIDFEGEDYIGPPMTVEDIVAEFEALGVHCIRASAATGLGIDEITAALLGRITVLSGQSGVGKSTLINCIQPGLQLGTADVSAESEKGRHTTSLARLLRLDIGAHVVDTPGIRTFSLWSVEPGELERYFAEFIPLVPKCRFNDCHHTDELDCAIRNAAQTGEISMRRYWSYVKMLEELAEERRR